MHARASAWFAVHGLFDEAIAHAVKAGDIEGAAALVEDQVHPSLDREDWRQVERWLGLLPEEVRNRPRLLVAQAWLGYVRYQFSSIATLLAAAEAALASSPTGSQATATMLRGEISTLRAAIAYGQDDAEEMEQWAQAALQELRPDMAYATGLAKYFHITALHGTGRYAAAVEFAHRQIEDSYARQANSAALRPWLALNNIHYEMADLSALKASAEMLLQITRHEEYGLSTAWAHDILGWVHYQRNELAEAEAGFRRVVLIAASAHGRAVVDGYTGLVLTALAQGRPQEALNAIATLRELLLERGMLAYSLVADSLQQRVALAGDPSSVSDWRPAGSTAKIPVEFWVQPALTQVRTLLTGGSRHGLAEATEILAVCRAQASKRHSRRRLIEVDALQALVHAAEGDEAAALATLRQAVELAAPGGTLRILVDCGPGLIGPLQKLQAEGVAPGYIQQVLAAYGASVVLAAAASSSQHPATQAATSGIRVEMLTNREIDVLILLAERLSDKEIAARLVLSPETIKKHTAHIYRKLGVDNRRACRCLRPPLESAIGAVLTPCPIPQTYPFLGATLCGFLAVELGCIWI